MSQRALAESFILMAVVLILPAPASSTGQGTEAGTWSPPQTAWGDPDLQGVWTNATTTPLERPDDLGDKAVLTGEEWAARNAVTGIRDVPDTGRDVGFYNDFWLEQGQLNERTSWIIDPPNGKLPVLTPEEQAHVAALTQARNQNYLSPRIWTDLNTFDRCITRSMPGTMMPGFYNHNYHIFQTPDYVVLAVEMIHDTRIIPLDGRPHLKPSIRQWLGDSRGHWEGNTLVVETTNLPHEPRERGLFVFTTGSGLRLVERFTRVAQDIIDYQFTAHDPSAFVQPLTLSTPMRPLGGTLFEFACHEGNYAIVNMLRGARAEEVAESGSR